MRCAIYSCKNDNQSKGFKKNVMFFRFPRDKNTCQKWIVACSRADKFNERYAHVCSVHFQPSDYKRDLKAELLNYQRYKNKRLLKSEAVPTLSLPLKLGAVEPSTSGYHLTNNEKRKVRIARRDNRRLIKTILDKKSENESQNCVQRRRKVLIEGFKNHDAVQKRVKLRTRTSRNKFYSTYFKQLSSSIRTEIL
ncbi:hypothetical protein RN001_001033 [Aquatica leii]|uniref:THAP-type domain-containing protein n=1 Tax=Aquatica leii TaxID=1421715 RepID=A0AAN7SJE9_9COLE|nr:hypothetical protein RN001_001033 [Aquatica leii]